MATLTVTATEHPELSPPSVRLDVTATGTPTVTSVTVTRTDVSGRAYPVRTSDGGPLPVSGGVATVWDPEIPYGTTSTYEVAATGATSDTDTALLDVAVPWLVHPGVPSRSMPAEFRIDTNAEEELGLEQGVFPILGSSTAVIVTGSLRQEPVSELIVGTETPAEEAAMRLLLSDGATLLLNVPPSAAVGMSTAYISVGSARVRRPSNVGSDPLRDFVLPYRTALRPSGGSQALRTWAVVNTQYGSPTWAALYTAAGSPTWAELSNPIT